MSENGRLNLAVIIPVFVNNLEGETQLYRALESISRQSVLPTEVILTSDNPGPEDSLFTRLHKDFSELHIQVVVNFGPRGISSNSNNGIRLAQSQYIHILHQDDWLIDTSAYKELGNYGLSDRSFLLLPGKRLNQSSLPKFDLTALLGNNRLGGPSGLVFPRESKVFFDEGLSMLCDVDFVFQLYKKFGKPQVFERFVIEYGVSDGQAQNHISQQQFSQEVKKVFTKYQPNRWKIASIAIFRYRSDSTYAIVKNLELLDNSFLFGYFLKIVTAYSRIISRLRRLFT
jgi:hypothetical protein